MKIRLQVSQPGDGDWSTLNETTSSGVPDDVRRAEATLVTHQQHWQQGFAPFANAAFRIARER